MQTGSIADALPTVGAYMQGAAQSGEKMNAGIDQAISDYRSKIAESDKLEGSLNPDAMAPPKLTPPPQPQQTDPLQGWGSAAMWIAALSGAMTRSHATTSLNAMGAVLNAYKQRDADAAKTAFEQWKVSNDNAIKSADYTINAYKAALEEIKTDREQAKADVLAVAAALKDEQTPYIIEHYGMDAFIRLLSAQQTHIDKMAEAQPKIDELQLKKQAQLKFLSAAQSLQAAQQTKDPQKIAAAQAEFHEAQTEMGAFQSGGSSANIRSLPALVARKFQEDHPDATVEETEAFAEEYGARTKAARDFATGPQGNLVRSFNTAVSHLNTLTGLVGALQNGDVTQINRLAQLAASQTGSAAPKNFDAAKAIVGDEIIKAVIGSAGALGDRDNAQNQLNKAESPEQLLGVIGTYKQLMTGQLISLKKQYTDTTGFDDFDQRLSTETRRELGVDSGQPDQSVTNAVRKAESQGHSAKGLPDGSRLKDAAGDVIATSQNGKWVPVKGVP